MTNNRLAGEYEKQEAALVLFPYRADIWRGGCLPAQKMIVGLANNIARFERCILGVVPSREEYLKQNFTLNQNVEVRPMAYNDCWPRDTVASVLVGDKKRVNAFGFNAYGTPLYESWDDDLKLNGQIYGGIFNYPVKNFPLILEWGNIATDGNGTIFVIEDAVVNENRNPNVTKEQAEKILLEATCGRQVVWLPRGLCFDETGGHIDNVLAFADGRTMLLSYTDDESNAHYKVTQELYALLKNCTDADGVKYNIIKLPVPDIYIRTEDDCRGIEVESSSYPRKSGDPVLLTYVNFALINGAVIAPRFDIPEDESARQILKQAFPDREIIMQNAREAFLSGGGFHCLTKHIN